MRINVNIERLVLDGLPAVGGDHGGLRTAVEARLAGLLMNREASKAFLTSWNTATILAPPLRMEEGMSGKMMGIRIADSLYRGLAGGL